MDDRTKLIIQLWNANKSASEIAKQIGVTKNSIIGKIARLRARNVELRTRLPLEKPESHRPIPLGRAIKLPLRLVEGGPPHKSTVVEGTRFVTLLGLTPRSCRYVVSDDTVDAVYCGATRTSKSYCTAHAELCYVKVKPCNSRTRSRR